MTILTDWLLLVALMTTAAVSPGPDFVVAVRNAVLYSRRTGLWTAVGFGLGVAVHVAYSLAGIAALIAQSVMLFNIVKYVGAAYLIWVGIGALRSKGFGDSIQIASDPAQMPFLSNFAAVRMGFITNLFNPKATLFFLAVFTQLVRPDVPLWAQGLYGATCITIVTVWFMLVATVLTQPRVRGIFLKASKWIDRACGGLLIAFGVRLALSKAA